MKYLTKSVCALMAVCLVAGTVGAADAISFGKVKTVNAEKKSFVLTDSTGKDFTIKFGDQVVINRNGKESGSDLSVAEKVTVQHDNGVLTWTANYILVQEEGSKDWAMYRGSVKSYDASKKQFTFTEGNGKDRSLPVGDAKVRLNKEDMKVEDVKIGDSVLVIVEKTGDKETLKSLMVTRK